MSIAGSRNSQSVTPPDNAQLGLVYNHSQYYPAGPPTNFNSGENSVQSSHSQSQVGSRGITWAGPPGSAVFLQADTSPSGYPVSAGSQRMVNGVGHMYQGPGITPAGTQHHGVQSHQDFIAPALTPGNMEGMYRMPMMIYQPQIARPGGVQQMAQVRRPMVPYSAAPQYTYVVQQGLPLPYMSQQASQQQQQQQQQQLIQLQSYPTQTQQSFQVPRSQVYPPPPTTRQPTPYPQASYNPQPISTPYYEEQAQQTNMQHSGLYYAPQSGPAVTMQSAQSSTSTTTRKKNVIAIIDPNTGKDVMATDTAQQQAMSLQSMNVIAGHSMTNIRVTPVSSELSLATSSSGDIAAQFAAQVAATLIPATEQQTSAPDNILEMPLGPTLSASPRPRVINTTSAVRFAMPNHGTVMQHATVESNVTPQTAVHHSDTQGTTEVSPAMPHTIMSANLPNVSNPPPQIGPRHLVPPLIPLVSLAQPPPSLPGVSIVADAVVRTESAVAGSTGEHTLQQPPSTATHMSTMQTSATHMSATRMPRMQVLGTHTPGAQTAAVQVPGVQFPGTLQMPGSQLPGVQVPGIQMPGPQGPGVRPPAMRMPAPRAMGVWSSGAAPQVLQPPQTTVGVRLSAQPVVTNNALNSTPNQQQCVSLTGITQLTSSTTMSSATSRVPAGLVQSDVDVYTSVCDSVNSTSTAVTADVHTQSLPSSQQQIHSTASSDTQDMTSSLVTETDEGKKNRKKKKVPTATLR